MNSQNFEDTIFNDDETSIADSSVAIKVQNLTKIYKLYDAPVQRLKEVIHPFRKKYHKDFYALNDVSFEIKKGETLGIIGKNGSGKSTLLKIITGVLTPSSGQVHVKGKISSLLELGAGFNPELSGLDNIFFYGTINGIEKEEMQTRVEKILDFADIGDFIHQPVKTYSSGMYVRLAFAVAIQIEPEILIIDEALAVGDIFFQQKCARRMSELKESGVTIIFVSHDMSSIRNLCNRVVCLKDGAIIFEGESSKAIYEYYKEGNKDLDFDSTLKNEIEIVSQKKEDVQADILEVNKSLKNSILGDRIFENEYIKIESINITNNKDDICFNYLIGETLYFTMYFKGKKVNRKLHCILIIRNKYDQIVFSGGSYNKQLNPLICNEDKIYCFKFNAKLNLEAGGYTLDVSIGEQLVEQLNRGQTIIEMNKLSTIFISWDYENEIPPFFGLFGLEYNVEWI